MAEIIERNPEDNPRLNEIYEILLVAGYFRIRISSLRPFDKVLGGMAWCITSSNFSIDVEYHDEMQIGEKIKASQIICDSLIRMKCPYNLQPFQLQGLDVNNIFPIVQWLIKFVYETRWERQKYDRELSLVLGRKITNIDNHGNPNNIIQVPLERKRINRAIKQTPLTHPVRVYSALLEYNDATATKMYNKLLNIITKKGKSKGKGGQSNQQGESMAEMLLNEDKESANQRASQMQDRSMDQFGNIDVGKIPLEKLELIIQSNKEQLQTGIKEVADESVLLLNRPKGNQTKDENNSSEVSQNQNQLVEASNASQSLQREEQKIILQAKQRNQKYEQKIQILDSQVQSFEMVERQLEAEIQALREKHAEARAAAEKELNRNNEYRELQQEMEQQLKQNKAQINAKLERLVERRQLLKNKKTEIKKKAKARIEQLTQEIQIAQAMVPEIDQQAFQEMLGEAELKKQIYDKKYEELTHVNKDLAVLQRKAENYTSPPEIAQYHQRFVELFESINVLIEEKRSLYSETTNLESLKKVVGNYIEIVKNIKEGYSGVKKKAELKELAENMKEYLEGLETNTRNSEITLGMIKSKRESTYAEYMDLIKLEREYLNLLRVLKLQYENAARQYN